MNGCRAAVEHLLEHHLLEHHLLEHHQEEP